MYQIIDNRTGEVLHEFFTFSTALIRYNALTFVFGRHYSLQPDAPQHHGDSPLPTTVPRYRLPPYKKGR